MIPQMPRHSRPFQLHSPASPGVRGHHRASEWVSVATAANGGRESGRGLLSLSLYPLPLFFSLFLFCLRRRGYRVSLQAGILGRGGEEPYFGTVPQWSVLVSALVSSRTMICFDFICETPALFVVFCLLHESHLCLKSSVQMHRHLLHYGCCLCSLNSATVVQYKS